MSPEEIAKFDELRERALDDLKDLERSGKKLNEVIAMPSNREAVAVCAQELREHAIRAGDPERIIKELHALFMAPFRDIQDRIDKLGEEREEIRRNRKVRS